MIYYRSRRNLPRTQDPYWQTHIVFNGETKNRVVPMQVTTSNFIKWGKEWETWLQGPQNRVGSKHDHVHKHDIKWHNIVFKLLYWEVKHCKPKTLNFN
jgi:hypothetical protein